MTSTGDRLCAPHVEHVFELLGVRKSIGKDSPDNGVEFNLPGGAIARVFESDIKASYACEQASNGGHPVVPVGGCSWRSGRRLWAFK